MSLKYANNPNDATRALSVKTASVTANDAIIKDRLVGYIIEALIKGVEASLNNYIHVTTDFNNHKERNEDKSLRFGTLSSMTNPLSFVMTSDVTTTNFLTFSEDLVTQLSSNYTSSIESADLCISEAGINWFSQLDEPTKQAIVRLVKDKINVDITSCQLYNVSTSESSALKAQCQVCFITSNSMFSGVLCDSSFVNGYVTNVKEATLESSSIYYKAIIAALTGGSAVNDWPVDTKTLEFPLFSKVIVEMQEGASRMAVYAPNDDFNLIDLRRVSFSLSNTEADNARRGIPNAVSWNFGANLQVETSNPYATIAGAPSEEPSEEPGAPSSSQTDVADQGCQCCSDILDIQSALDCNRRLNEVETQLREAKVKLRYRNIILGVLAAKILLG